MECRDTNQITIQLPQEKKTVVMISNLNNYKKRDFKKTAKNNWIRDT